jgi:anti-sigma regulatory factor (Ser/Thr protein kinase)
VAQPDPRRFELELPADPVSVRRARVAVSAFADENGADAAVVALCVSEAVTNAVVHAYRDADLPGTIRVRGATGPGGIVVEVEDDGAGMEPRSDSPGLGLGLPIIASLASRLDVMQGDTGALVRMRFGI